MTGLAAPGWLGLLPVLAVLAGGYGWMQRRRRRYTLRFANLALLERVAARHPSRWRRHGPPALLAVALILLTVGLAGPTATARVPTDRATVMLVVDVSLSMSATDIAPTRLSAAENAATRFVTELPRGVHLGVEEFAADPIVLAAPSTDRQRAQAALHQLKLAASTNTGAALQTALGTIRAANATLGGPGGPPPARIVLESDGKQTTGPSEFAVATQAGRARVPIDTISIGTPGGVITLDDQLVPVPVDDASLAQVAHLSGGRSFTAHTAAAAHQVYSTLGHQIGYRSETVDAGRPWLIAGTLTALLAVALALTLTQRIPV